ncbi:MAG: hypothetical protein PHP02_08380 [Eubacteriales bacterium]|nr:hypothetical protein [Eubacteriales bacterium]
MNERFSEKIYVGVLSLTHPDGSIVPLKLIWPDGRQWEIDRMLDVRPGVARKAGGEGMRFLCRISGHERELWYSHGQWFVEGSEISDTV